MRTTYDTLQPLSLSGGGEGSAVNGSSPSAAQSALNARILANVMACNTRGTTSDVTYASLLRGDVVKTEVIDGWREPQPYAASWETRSLIGTGSVGAQAASIGSWWNGAYWLNYTISVSRDIAVCQLADTALPRESPNLENQLLARCYSQIKDVTFDLGMAILESRESFGTLGSVLRKLRAVMDAVRRKDLRPLQREFGFRTRHRNSKTGQYTADAGALWLEALYGIRPIILDIYNIVELIDKQLREENFMIAARASGKTVSVLGQEHVIIGTGGSGFYNPSVQGEVESKQKVALWFKLEKPGLALAASLGLTNPIGWMWEKTPLSFVVDWLIPLGSVISQLDATLGFDYLGGTHTHWAEARGLVQANRPGMHVPAGWSLSHDTSLCVADRAVVKGKMERRVYNSPPTITPFIKDPFNVAHVVTTIALIAGKKVR